MAKAHTIHALAIIAIAVAGFFFVKASIHVDFSERCHSLEMTYTSKRGSMAHPRKDSATRKAGRSRNAILIDLDQYLPYLINRVGNTLVQLFSRDLAQFDISVPMWRVIAVLGERGDLRLVDLSSMTSIDASTLSRLTETMQRRKLLGRSRSPQNKREIVISTTPKGQELLRILTPIAAAYEREMTVGLSASELATAREALRQMFVRLAELRAKATQEMSRARRQMPVLAKHVVGPFRGI
jgi:DNA-binding MarR family transcriptional regulator